MTFFSKYCNIIQEESFPFCPIFDLGGVVFVIRGWCRLGKDRDMGRTEKDIKKKNELGLIFLSLVVFCPVPSQEQQLHLTGKYVTEKKYTKKI